MDNRKRIAAFAVGVGLAYVILRHRKSIYQTLKRAWNYDKMICQKHIKVINSIHESHSVIQELQKKCESYKVLGFDCEWVTVGGSRRPVALLQLSSHDGLCALFRLCNMKQIPKDLRNLLEDDRILKVGVAPQGDAAKLARDYGLGVASTLDLRYMAVLAGHKAEGLGKLSKTHLNFELDKNWRLACSNWEAKELDEKQLNYAAYDALAAIAIYHKLSKDLEPRIYRGGVRDEKLRERLEPFVDVDFNKGFAGIVPEQNQPQAGTPLTTKVKAKKIRRQQKIQSRQIGTQATKVFYDNCLLEAPDGELLCTIDRRKASWYLSQNLGTQISESPFTVRLNFEPAGRAVGDIGRYYQTPKENKCVVCGETDAFIRKNIVPREYRRHFPIVMKSHSSHDVVLLCPTCHQISNISDYRIRTMLVDKCDAPIVIQKYNEDHDLKKIKSTGRALLKHRERLPEHKISEMTKQLLDFYSEEVELTEELIQMAANVDARTGNLEYSQHGGKVVQEYTNKYGGLIELEKLWREHFLKVMKPKFMPDLWNVNHSAGKLEVLANEGRIDDSDLIVAGLEPIQKDYELN